VVQASPLAEEIIRSRQVQALRDLRPVPLLCQAEGLVQRLRLDCPESPYQRVLVRARRGDRLLPKPGELAAQFRPCLL
jgi:hypothetical protein